MATYTVQSGDSWESIAGQVYGDQRMFGELERANAGISMLRPGMTIDLPDQRSNPYVAPVEAAAAGMGGGGFSDPSLNALSSAVNAANLFYNPSNAGGFYNLNRLAQGAAGGTGTGGALGTTATGYAPETGNMATMYARQASGQAQPTGMLANPAQVPNQVITQRAVKPPPVTPMGVGAENIYAAQAQGAIPQQPTAQRINRATRTGGALTGQRAEQGQMQAQLAAAGITQPAADLNAAFAAGTPGAGQSANPVSAALTPRQAQRPQQPRANEPTPITPDYAPQANFIFNQISTAMQGGGTLPMYVTDQVFQSMVAQSGYAANDMAQALSELGYQYDTKYKMWRTPGMIVQDYGVAPLPALGTTGNTYPGEFAGIPQVTLPPGYGGPQFNYTSPGGAGGGGGGGTTTTTPSTYRFGTVSGNVRMRP